jgi:hypothetical protein
MGDPIGEHSSVPDNVDREELMSMLLSRRSALTVGAFASLIAVVGSDLIAPPVAHATAPTSAGGVVDEARSYVGLTLGSIRSGVDSPWSGYGDYDWCAWFASWCIRGLGLGMLTWATDIANVGTLVSSPAVGDMCLFGTSHVGIVSKRVGSTWYLIDGNGESTGTGITTRVVAERPIWNSPHTFYRPNYSGTTSTTQENLMAMMFNKNGQMVWAMAGAGPGTAAWIELTDGPLAAALATYINGKTSVALTIPQWDAMKAAFTSAQNVHTV